MRRTVARLLDSKIPLWTSAAASLALGLFFIFVWAPHPWGWAGIDFYFERARALARGEEFGTTDVPWGYAYFIAACYRLFGDRQWAPLVVQAIGNAAIPFFIFNITSILATRRIAMIAAVLTGFLSFNTVYASTLASDSACTVLFIAGLWCFVHAHRRQSMLLFAASGLVAGLVPQFRPNLILLPAVAALFVLWKDANRRRALLHAVVFLALTAAALTPWIVRNHRLTGMFLPTSTHGGEQLWYGSLQVGPFLENRALNPRTAFRSAPFDYTSVVSQPPVVTVDHPGCPGQSDRLALVYWTDRDPVRRSLQPIDPAAAHAQFELPRQPDGTVLYHYFEDRVAAEDSPVLLPRGGAANPFVTFISTNHLADLDAHGDTLDIFDIVRMARHLAWHEPLPFADRLDLNGDGVVDQKDLDLAIDAVLPEAGRMARPPIAVATEETRVTLHLPDNSWVRIQRALGGRQTDLELDGGPLATALVSRWVTYTAIAQAREPKGPPVCAPIAAIGVNQVFYRGEPHMQARYIALAADNIRRAPSQFALASIYRMFRLFMIRGTSDVSAAQQFENSGFAYGAGQALSLAYVTLFIAGVIVAWRRRSALLALLIPIVYVPVTICVVLTNMRYTVTMQPLMFAFMAVAISALLKLEDAPDEAGA